MASQITQQYKESLSELDNIAKDIESEWIAATNRRDEDGINKAMEQFNKLQQEERPRIDQKYQDLQFQRKKELIDGIASGNLVNDKTIVATSSPTYGYGAMGGETSYAEEFKFNPKKAKTALSELLEVTKDRIDLDGLDAKVVTELDLLRDPDAMEYHLKENLKFPKVIRQVINGKPNFIVEDPMASESQDGSQNKYRVVFKNGIQGADVAGFLASNALPTTGSIAGGVIGAGVGAPTGPGAIATGIAGSATGNMIVGTAQDSAVRGILGVPQNFKEILATRGMESLVGAGADALTLGVFSKTGVAKIGSEAIENAVAKSLREAEELLVRKGHKVSIPDGYISGTKGGEYERMIAAGSPDMEVAKNMIRQQKVAYEFKEAAIKGSPVVDKIGTLEMIKKNLINTADILSSKAQKIAGMPKEFAERRLARLTPDKTNWVEGGTGMAEVLTKGRETTRLAKNAEFDGWAESTTATQTPEELVTLLRPIMEGSGQGKNPVFEGILTKLGNAPWDRQAADELATEIQRAEAKGLLVPESAYIKLKDLREYSQPFDARASRDLIQKFQADIPDTPIGWNKSDVTTQKVTEALRDNFQSKLNPQELAGWNKFKGAYTDYLSFEKGQIGKMVTEVFGDLKIAPEEILKRSIRDTKSVNDVLNAAKAAGDVEGEAYLRSTMRKAYLEQTGLTSKQGFTPTKSDFNDEMIDVLFGTSAPRMKESLRELNQSLAGSKVKIVNFDQKDITRLIDSPMPLNDRKKLIAEITDKAVKQEAYDNFVKNSIVQKVKAGDYRHVDNIIYGESMLDAKTSDLLEIVGKMSPKMKQSTGADMMAAFFEKFGAKGNNAKRFEIPNSPAAEKTAGQMLWDHQAVIDSLGTWNREKGGAPAWVSNMDAVTGTKEMADELIAFSRVAESNRLLGSAEAIELRGMASATGVKVYSAPFEYVGHKMLATLYGSNKLRPFLRTMRKNVGEEAQQKAMQEMIRGVVTTRTGIQAAMQQSQNDPEFSEQFQTIMLKVREDIDRERQAAQPR